MSTYSNLKINKSNNAYQVGSHKFFPQIDNNIIFGLKIFVFAIAMNAAVFTFLYWCLSPINLHYAVKTLIVFVVANLLVNLIDLSNEFKKRLKGASRPLLIICLMVSLAIGFGKYGAGKLDPFLKDPFYLMK